MKTQYLDLDNDGYPTDECLEYIKNYDCTDIEDFLEGLKLIWAYSDWGFKLTKVYKSNGWQHRKQRTLQLHTAGWSGNESIINALQSNFIFWSMYWWKTYRGGHYYFQIPV